jgi:hypothetical protein
VTVDLRQKRFAVDGSANETTEWTVPVYASAAGSAESVLGFVKGDQNTKISVSGSAPIKLNAGQTVYYRVDYGGAFAALADRFDAFDPADQLGLLNDAYALGEAGVAPISDYLDLTPKLSPATDRVVCRQIIETLLAIDSLYAAGTQRDALQAYGRRLLKPVFDSIGWDQKPSEKSNETVLREYLITALAQLGQPEIKVEAEQRFSAYAAGNSAALPAIIRRPVLQAAALGADAALYDAMRRLAKSTTDSFGKDQLFVALATADDASLAQQSLEIALGDDPAKTTGPKMIQRVAVRHPDLAWDFALKNLTKVNERLDELQRFNFVPSLTATSLSAKVLEQLQRYIADKVPEVARKSVARFVADLKFRLAVAKDRVPDIDTWLANHTAH